MRRWVPYSLLLHVVLLAVMVWFGTFVDPPRRTPQRVVRVTLRQEPRERPPAPQEQAPETPVEQPVAQPEATPPPAEKPPERPRPTPEARPEDRPVRRREETPPEPEREEPEETPAETPAVAAPAPERSQITAVDQPFPYQYYTSLIEGTLNRNWHPKQLGFRDRSARTCTVHFFIERDGTITRETIVGSSGIPLFDREALQAVKTTRSFPPLPSGFATRALGVTFVFTLRSGL